mgnify:CR=1 FL=1
MRADLVDGGWICRSGARATGSSVAEAMGAARSLGDETGKKVWLLSDEWFSQSFTLNPAQIAGLNDEQLGRALAFEAEPFSGIPMTSAALGFLRAGEGSFEVVALPAEVRSRLMDLAGGAFGGIAAAGPPPEDDDGMRQWAAILSGDLEGRRGPVVSAPAAPPSANRFRTAGFLMEAAAMLLLCASWWWIKSETLALRKKQSEYTSVANDLAAANLRIKNAGAEITNLRTDLDAANSLAARRLAVPVLLQSLGLQKSDDVVLSKIDVDGPSSSLIRGVALNPDAVDELSIVLKEALKPAGWSVFPGQKKGMRKLPNGGPWEVSLSIVHAEAAKEGVQMTEDSY